MSIVSLAGGQSEDYTAWIFFASLAVCGLGRDFADLPSLAIWFWLSSQIGFIIRVHIHLHNVAGRRRPGDAVQPDWGVGAAASFVFVSRLSLLRQVITPTVAGTVLMLVAATVILSVLNRLPDMPAGAPDVAAPVLAGVTLIVLVGMRCSRRPHCSSGRLSSG